MDGSREYTAKSGYMLLLHGNIAKLNCPDKLIVTMDTTFFPKLWALVLPQKIKSIYGIHTMIFYLLMRIWKKGIFFQFGKKASGGCPMCKEGLKSMDHILRLYPTTIQVLDSLNIICSPASTHSNDKQWLIASFNLGSDMNIKFLTVVIWAIWFARNRLLCNSSIFSDIENSNFEIKTSMS